MTAVDMFATDRVQTEAPLPLRFLEHADADPGRVALSWSGEPWTFGRLAGRARSYAALLAERIPVGGWVAVCAERSPEVVGLVLGALLAGRAVVPLEPAHPVPRLRSTLLDAEPALLVHDHNAAAELIISWTGETASLDDIAAEVVLVDDPEPVAPEPSDIAYVIYTSGSTGTPKGVMVQHEQLAALVEARATADPVIGSGDVVLSVASLAFDMMVTDIFVTLALGGRVVLPPGGARQRDPDVLLDAIDEHGVTTVYATPSLLQMLVYAGLGEAGRRRVRVLTGGEAFAEQLAAELITRTSAVYNGYGPTETTVYASFHPVGDHRHRPLGRPIPGVSFYPLDDQLCVLPMYVRAELAIGGRLVSAGYHRRAALTAERFRPDPYSPVPGARCYLSADMVKVDSAGDVIFTGRKDSQVKIRGHRVEPSEVEAVLTGLDLVEQAAVVAATDSRGAVELVAYYAGPAGADELRDELRSRLPEAMVPARLVAVDDIPLTVNGKLDRDALVLREVAAGGGGDPSGADPGSAEPASELECSIAAIWCEVLERAEVGATQSFFDLGGHSLLAMEIVARIRAEWGASLSVWELFAEPTVRAWAAALQQALGAQGEDEQQRSAPVSFAQAALCIAEQVVPGSTSPGQVTSYELAVDHDLDTGRLLAALETVALRHESLRTRIELRGADSLQIVEPFAEIEFDERLVADRTEQDAVVEEWSAEPFDLDGGPLFRVLLTEQRNPGGPGTRFGLHLCLHDVIGDRHSADVVAADLAAAYVGGPTAPADVLLEDGVATDPEPLASILDLCRLQRSQAVGPEAGELLSRWERRLDRRPLHSDGDFTTLLAPVRIPPETVELCAEVASSADADLETVLVAALLRTCAGRLGGVLRDARTPATDALVGRLAQTLVLPCERLGEDATVAEQVASVRAARSWADDNPVPAELLTQQFPGRVAVPDVVVAITDEPDERLGDPRFAVTRIDRLPDGVRAGQRTAVAIETELRRDPDGALAGLIQVRPSALGAATTEQLLADLSGQLLRWLGAA